MYARNPRNYFYVLFSIVLASEVFVSNKSLDAKKAYFMSKKLGSLENEKIIKIRLGIDIFLFFDS